MNMYHKALPEHGRSASYGWDRPLQYYSLTVSEGDAMIYSNLDDSAAQHGTYGGGLSLKQLCERLAGHGVVLEHGELEQLRQDAEEPAQLAPGIRGLLDHLNRR